MNTAAGFLPMITPTRLKPYGGAVGLTATTLPFAGLAATGDGSWPDKPGKFGMPSLRLGVGVGVCIGFEAGRAFESTSGLNGSREAYSPFTRSFCCGAD